MYLRYLWSKYKCDQYVGQVVKVKQYNPYHMPGMMQVEFLDGNLSWFAINSDMHGFEEVPE